MAIKCLSIEWSWPGYYVLLEAAWCGLILDQCGLILDLCGLIQSSDSRDHVTLHAKDETLYMMALQSNPISLYCAQVLLVKPVTFMNNSGESVSALAKFYKVSQWGVCQWGFCQCTGQVLQGENARHMYES